VTPRLIVSLAPFGNSASISSVMRIVAFGSEPSNAITSSAMVFRRDLAKVGLTSTLPRNAFAFAARAGPTPPDFWPGSVPSLTPCVVELEFETHNRDGKILLVPVR
jgi:hypothetical protein